MVRWVVVLLALWTACSSTPLRMGEAPRTPAHALFENAGDEALLLINGNIWLVPVHAGRHLRRLDELAEFIHSLPTPPDVITLQEVWPARRVASLAALFPEYDLYTSGASRRVLGLKINESGLVTLVRRELEVTRVDYTLLDRSQLVSYNRIVGKGALALEVRHRGHSHRIVNVHLPNTFGGRFTWKTRQAFESLGLDGVVAGDLNLEPHELPARLEIEDHTPTFGNDGLGRERRRRIDYVLADAVTTVQSVVVTDAQGRCLPVSDHCVLAARLSPRGDSALEAASEAVTMAVADPTDRHAAPHLNPGPDAGSE